MIRNDESIISKHWRFVIFIIYTDYISNSSVKGRSAAGQGVEPAGKAGWHRPWRPPGEPSLLVSPTLDGGAYVHQVHPCEQT